MTTRIRMTAILATLLASTFAVLVPSAEAAPCTYAEVQQDCEVYCYYPNKGWGYYCSCDIAIRGHCYYADGAAGRIFTLVETRDNDGRDGPVKANIFEFATPNAFLL